MIWSVITTRKEKCIEKTRSFLNLMVVNEARFFHHFVNNLLNTKVTTINSWLWSKNIDNIDTRYGIQRITDQLCVINFWHIHYKWIEKVCLHMRERYKKQQAVRRYEWMNEWKIYWPYNAEGIDKYNIWFSQ